tara:strand:+ start:18060 stop:18305 length:246 start_codon:yes stop_codon:yes gene_type:complete
METSKKITKRTEYETSLSRIDLLEAVLTEITDSWHEEHDLRKAVVMIEHASLPDGHVILTHVAPDAKITVSWNTETVTEED